MLGDPVVTNGVSVGDLTHSASLVKRQHYRPVGTYAHWEELLQSVSDFIFSTADAQPGVSGVSKDQKFCEKFKNTHCQVDHPAKIE